MNSIQHVIKSVSRNHQFIKFLLTGVINTIFGYSVFALFIYTGFEYYVATLANTILGVVFNYVTIGRFVFVDSKKENTFVQFVLVYTLLYAVGTLLIRTINIFTGNFYVSGAINALIMPVIAFSLNKKFVFRESLVEK